MKEFILTFSKNGNEYKIRRYLSPKMAAQSIIWASQKMTDKNGIKIIGCKEITGISPKDFIPSII